jgi:hypothetical protein
LRRLHVGAFALVLLGGCGALGLRAFEAPEAVTVDQALERFRAARSAAPVVASPASPAPAPPATRQPRQAVRGGAATPTARAPEPTAPTAPTRAARAAIGAQPEGVYVYATTGHETGGAGPARSRHDYPGQTTTTVQRAGCGTSQRWEPVEGRWDDVHSCVTGDTVKIVLYDTMHTFFGVSERHTYECHGDSWLRPPSTAPGFRWSFDCDSDRARTHTEARVVGIERVSVGGATVEAIHVRFDTTMSGATEGTNPSDYWLALHEPYLLRKSGRVDAKVHTDAGTLDYHEEYDVRLTSRTPRT